MSTLVSYGMGSSDESEGSDNEDVAPVPKPEPDQAPTHPKKSSLFASLPKPKGSHLSSGPPPDFLSSSSGSVATSGRSVTGNSSLCDGDSEPRKKKSLFSSLPPPKKESNLSSFRDSKLSHQPSATTIGAKTTPTGISKGLLNLPPPKKKQPVKISLPSLPDPDSDDDEPEEKKPKTTKGAGLFSMLPKPRTASRKEANRLLIPHTLTKKPPQPTAKPADNATLHTKPIPPALPSTGRTNLGPKPTGSNPLVTGYNSDEEDEDDGKGVNFFSMGNDDKKVDDTTNAGPQIQTTSDYVISQNSLNTGGHEDVLQSGQASQSDGQVSRTGSGAENSVGPRRMETTLPMAQDQPLVFNPSKSYSTGYTPQNFHQAAYDQNLVQSSHSSNYAYPGDGGSQYGMYDQTGHVEGQGSSSMQYYNEPHQDGEVGGGYHAGGSATQPPETQQHLLEDEGFAKMVGKNNRGKEAIHIIDINADDQIGPTTGLQKMVKSMTEEKEYRGKLKKEQLPTSQQKRKHQITYLARQAKERELELKNQWADNRATRKQTQGKYGF